MFGLSEVVGQFKQRAPSDHLLLYILIMIGSINRRLFVLTELKYRDAKPRVFRDGIRSNVDKMSKSRYVGSSYLLI